MEVKYRYWAPDEGLEEVQAEIFNKNNPEYATPATAEDILERFKREEIDPKTVRFAFTSDGKPLAYVQARDYTETKETHIGYPWALPECPEGVQDKLFDKLLDYIKGREEAKEIEIRANASVSQENLVEFFKKKGLVIKERSHRYELELDALSKVDDSDSGYTTRKGTKDDLDLLVEFLKIDGRFSGQFPNDEDIAKYFTERVLPADHAVLIFKDDKLVTASAPLVYKLPGEEQESLILRFHSFPQKLVEDFKSYRSLLIGVAKECQDTNYGTDKTISVFHGPSDPETHVSIAEEYQTKKEVNGYSFGLKE